MKGSDVDIRGGVIGKIDVVISWVLFKNIQLGHVKTF